MKNLVPKIVFGFITLLLFSACNVNKEIPYLIDAGKIAVLTDSDIPVSIPDPVFQVGDLLVITVNADTPEAATPFNLPLVPSGVTAYNPTSSQITSYGGSGSLQNYLVDTNGNITMPIVGKIHVAGMTKSGLIKVLKDKIYPRYIKEEPIILVRFANFNVSVLGEVTHPGNFIIPNDKVSIFEAIALAGDLSIFGRRDNVLLIREGAGGRETIRLDLRDKRLVNSSYYYLQQNDVLYIQPNDPKSRSSALSTAETLSLSLVGTFISLTSLLVTILK